MLRTDGRTYLQDGCSEVPNGPWPLQIYGVNLKRFPHRVNLTRLTPQAHFNPITPSYPNLTKHGCTDCEPHNVSWACTDRRTNRGSGPTTRPVFAKATQVKKGIIISYQNQSLVHRYVHEYICPSFTFLVNASPLNLLNIAVATSNFVPE